MPSNEHGPLPTVGLGQLRTASDVALDELRRAVGRLSREPRRAVCALEELGDDLAHDLARELDGEVERDGARARDDEEDEPRQAEDRRRRRSVVVHREGEVRDYGEGDGRGEEVDARAELAEVAEDDVAKHHLSDAGRLNDKEPADAEDGVAERQLGVVLDVDDRHAVVDVVSDDGDPLEDEGDDNEDGLECDALVRRPLCSDAVEVAVGVQVGDGEPDEGDLEPLFASAEHFPQSKTLVLTKK